MILAASPLPVGNAARLYLARPPGVLWQRILRRPDALFAGATDPGASVVVDQSIDDTVLDTVGLINNTPVYYLDFGWNGAAFVAGLAPVMLTPAATYGVDVFDPQTVVRDRLALGLAVEVAAGRLKPAAGKIPVLTSPYALQDAITFPVVSVNLENESPVERFIGEELFSNYGDDIDSVDDGAGWMRHVRLSVTGVSQNSDERIALRIALRRVVLANLAVFDDAGMTLVTFSQSDTEEFTEKGVSLFMTVGTFECQAFAYVTEPAAALITVDTQILVTVPGSFPDV